MSKIPFYVALKIDVLDVILTFKGENNLVYDRVFARLPVVCECVK